MRTAFARASARATGVLRGLVVLLLAFPLLIATSVAASASDQSQDARSAHYGQLSARWWQWAVASPAGSNPLTDPDGTQCANAQSGPVWFLAGVLGGVPDGEVVSRSCQIPAHTQLFFPVANSFSCPDLGQTSTFAEQLKAARAGFTNIGGIAVTLDGRSVPAPQIRYTESVAFSLTLSRYNVFGAPIGTYRPCADVGYYVLIAPLSPGAHTIHFTASQAGSQIQNVIYTLVVPRPHKTS